MFDTLLGFFAGGSMVSGGVLGLTGYRWYKSTKQKDVVSEAISLVGDAVREEKPTSVLAEASKTCVDRAVELGEYMLKKFEHRGGYDSGIKSRLDQYKTAKDLFNNLKGKSESSEKAIGDCESGQKTDGVERQP